MTVAITAGTGPTGATLSGGISAISITAAGSGYTASPTVDDLAPNIAGGIQAVATATETGGVVTGFTITNAGTGYTLPPTITIVSGHRRRHRRDRHGDAGDDRAGRRRRGEVPGRVAHHGRHRLHAHGLQRRVHRRDHRSFNITVRGRHRSSS